MLEGKVSIIQLLILWVTHTHEDKYINSNVIIAYIRALDNFIEMSKTNKKLIPTVFHQGEVSQ